MLLQEDHMNLLKKIARKVSRNASNPQGPKPLILNEAVNFEKQCIFIAVPKTGTTSVRVQIKQRGIPLIPNPHLDIMQIRDALYTYFLTRSLAKNESFPSESVPKDKDIRTQANNVFNTYFKFSAVRNPWARAVSLYFRGEGIQLKDRCSFDEFCQNHFYASDTCRHPTLHRNQIDWLLDEKGEVLMDYVYKLENFEEAIKEILERTDGRLRITNRNLNKNPQSLSRKYRDLYTEKTKKIIAERFAKDIDFFKYSF